MRETQKKGIGKYIVGHGYLSTRVGSIESDDSHADRERDRERVRQGKRGLPG